MTLWEEIEEVAQAHRDRPALVMSGATTAYGELRAAVETAFQRLREAGLLPEGTLAVRMESAAGSVAHLLAGIRLGARVLPLDPLLKPDELARAGAQAGGMLVASAAGIGGWVGTAGAMVSADVGGAAAPSEFLFLSSGTEGLPKLVLRTAQQMDALMAIYLSGFPRSASDRMLGAMPMCHAHGFCNGLLGSLMTGAAFYAEPIEPRILAETIERERINMVLAPPFMLHLLNQTSFRKEPDFSSVRLFLTGGAAVSPAVVRAFCERFGISLTLSYGATEAGHVGCGCDRERQLDQGWVGHPHRGVTVEIRDDDGRPLPAGQEGAVAVRSPAVASGYLGYKDDAFRDGWFVIGDIGRLDADGHLYVLGRRRPMINVAGKKVSPLEVELCLRSHPAVAEVLVTASESTAGQRVKASVVRMAEVTAAELRQYCGARLADYKVPRQVEFVATLGKGPMGKPSAGDK